MGHKDSPETDSAILFNDEIQDIIGHQITVYTHLRNQAQRLIRILIAAGAIIIAVASSDIIRISDIENLPRYHSRIASNLSVSPEFIELTSQVNFFIGGMFLITGLVLVLDSFFWAAKVLRMRGLQPLLGEASSTDVSVVTYSPTDDLDGLALEETERRDREAKEWLENNDSLLYTAKERLRLTYERLRDGISILLLAGVVLVSAQMGLGQILALIDGSFVVVVIGVSGWESWKGWKWFRSWRKKGEFPFTEAAQDVLGEKISDWPHCVLLMFLFIFVYYAFIFSLISTLAWSFGVVFPFLSTLI